MITFGFCNILKRLQLASIPSNKLGRVCLCHKLCSGSSAKKYRISGMTTHPPSSPEPQKPLEIVQSELEAALVFSEFSSRAYSHGNLQRAIDARAKAERVFTRATETLSAPGISEQDSRVARLMLDEVKGTLARLPASSEFHFRALRAS